MLSLVFYERSPFDSYNVVLCKIPQKHLSFEETTELGAIKLLSGLLRRVVCICNYNLTLCKISAANAYCFDKIKLL